VSFITSRRLRPSVSIVGAKCTRAVMALRAMMSAIDSKKVVSPTNDASRHSVPSGSS